VTGPNADGIGLVYDHRPVRTRDGRPLFFTWQQLAVLAADAQGEHGRPAFATEAARRAQAQAEFKRQMQRAEEARSASLAGEQARSPQSKVAPVGAKPVPLVSEGTP
jgi:hypothetical protein